MSIASAPKAASKEQAPSLQFLQSLVAQDLAKVDALILARVEQDVPMIAQLARHIIASGGKRLRPALTLLTAGLCGYEGEKHITLSACVELIHTATLLHDDVVDESKLRRGLATANDLWGNKASVLVGDFLLSRAFQLMVDTGSLKVLKILSDTSAIIARGEVMQLTTVNDVSTSKERYLEVIEAKTAALFAAACELGAVVAEQEKNEPLLRGLGMQLGIAFQLVDDALDYSAEQATLGKNIGDDFREGKITLPVILAYSRATPEEKTFWHRTVQDLEQHEDDFDTACKLIARHQGIEETLTLAESYCQDARNALAAFPDKPEKQALLEAIDFCVKRLY